MAGIELEKRPDGIGLITFNRPERLNAVGGEEIDTLGLMLEECAKDDAVRCVALTGAGRGFCAGGDVKGMAGTAGSDARPGSLEEKVEGQQRLHMHVTPKLVEMPKPTVSLINGVATGGGFVWAIACDVRLASDQARFGTAYAKIGLSGDFGACSLLYRLVPNFAHELLYTADIFDAQRALEIGLVNRVIPHDRFMEEGMAFCARLAAGPTYAYARIKENIASAWAGSLEADMHVEARNFILTRQSEDHARGSRAFVEKRPPEYVGR